MTDAMRETEDRIEFLEGKIEKSERQYAIEKAIIDFDKKHGHVQVFYFQNMARAVHEIVEKERDAALQAENAKLREALTEIAGAKPHHAGQTVNEYHFQMKARAALSGQDAEGET